MVVVVLASVPETLVGLAAAAEEAILPTAAAEQPAKVVQVGTAQSAQVSRAVVVVVVDPALAVLTPHLRLAVPVAQGPPQQSPVRASRERVVPVVVAVRLAVPAVPAAAALVAAVRQVTQLRAAQIPVVEAGDLLALRVEPVAQASSSCPSPRRILPRFPAA